MNAARRRRRGGRVARVGATSAVDPAMWRVAVIGITALAVLVRLLIIAHSHGGVDLKQYVYYSRLPLHGVNPFTPPPSQLYPPLDSNNPPIEVAVFTGLLWVHNSPLTLRLLFTLSDALLLLLVGFRFPRPRRWRIGFMLFYGFNPFVLFSYTAFAEDKTLLVLGIACWVLALERDNEWGAWAAATALTVFKFLGAFAVPALALHSWRRRGARAVLPIGAFLAAFLLSNLPWFPHSLDAFARRDTRLGLNPPNHASPTLVLARIGIYSPVEAKILTAAAVIAVFVLFARRRIDVREAVVWSLFAGYIFLPDDPFNRILLITLPLLLLIDLSVRRWLALWLVSCWAALAAVVATKGVPHALRAIAGPLQSVFAHETTLRHVLWINMFPALVIAYYAIDRRAGRAPVGGTPEPAKRERVVAAVKQGAR